MLEFMQNFVKRLPKSIRKRIRKDKAAIRRSFFADPEQQQSAIYKRYAALGILRTAPQRALPAEAEAEKIDKPSKTSKIKSYVKDSAPTRRKKT